jgi:hypothetical protein
MAWNIFQLFHDICAQLLEAAATVSADITGRDPLFYPLEAPGEGLALARGARRLGLLFSVWRVVTGLPNLMFFEHQLQRKLIQTFRARPKAVFLVPVQLQAQIRDDGVVVLDCQRMGDAFCNQLSCLCGDVGLRIRGKIRQIWKRFTYAIFYQMDTVL